MNKNEKNQIIIKKLHGINKALNIILTQPQTWFGYSNVCDFFNNYHHFAKQLLEVSSDLYFEIPIVLMDKKVLDGTTCVSKESLTALKAALGYIFRISPKYQSHYTKKQSRLKCIFISHGRSDAWREVQDFIKNDLKIKTSEYSQKPREKPFVLANIEKLASKCSYAVIVMTKDDFVSKSKPRARENVIHEIGFFQGKYGLDNVNVLYQRGTNIPSNLSGLIYRPFKKGDIKSTFNDLQRDIKKIFKI